MRGKAFHFARFDFIFLIVPYVLYKRKACKKVVIPTNYSSFLYTIGANTFLLNLLKCCTKIAMTILAIPPVIFCLIFRKALGYRTPVIFIIV